MCAAKEMWTEVRREMLTDGMAGRAVCRGCGGAATLAKMPIQAEPPGYRRRAESGKPIQGLYLTRTHDLLCFIRTIPHPTRWSREVPQEGSPKADLPPLNSTTPRERIWWCYGQRRVLDVTRKVAAYADHPKATPG